MTEEIINGVDVSECEYLEKSIPIDCSIANCFCYENKNCYYKQLKRLEFENKLLKADYEASEAENVKLKEKTKLLEKISTHLTDNSLFSVRYFTKENTKLKEKLKKIKELATPLSCNNPLDCWMNQDVGTDDIYGCEGDDYKGCPNGFASCILKIIEGAEDE